ncbi:MAG: hypothetical protein HRF44_08025 [Ignavibacterium sp.]|jgi:hypothetical protein
MKTVNGKRFPVNPGWREARLKRKAPVKGAVVNPLPAVLVRIAKKGLKLKKIGY